MDCLGSPQLRGETEIWVGSRAFPVWEVMAAAMTVGLWRLPVSVLHDEHRAHAPLLAAHHRAEIGVEDVASFHTVVHVRSHSAGRDSARYPAKGLCNAAL